MAIDSDYSIEYLIERSLIARTESDRDGDAAGVTDGLFAIARSIHDLADAVRGKSEEVPTRDDSYFGPG